MQGQLPFLPFPPFAPLTILLSFLPHTASIHPLCTFPFLASTLSFCRALFPQADIKAGPVGGRGLV